MSDRTTSMDTIVTQHFLQSYGVVCESALEDSEVSESMINGPANVWVERAGRLTAHAAPDLDEAALLRAAIHIACPLGLDPSTSPIVDARLDDGSRVAICVPPASPQVAITVRRFGKRAFSADDLVKQGALPQTEEGFVQESGMAESEAASQPPFKPVANVQQLMHDVVYPNADAVWESVGTIISYEGTEEIYPRNDE